MNIIMRYIYARPLGLVLLTILVCIISWALINRKTSKHYHKLLKYINIALLVCEIIVVIYTTIISRTPTEIEVCIIPFYSFVLAKKEPEMYRSMLMNILLFVPLGMTMPYILLARDEQKTFLTMGYALLFSIAIESMQYIYRLGRVEIDDVICNTLGATIGGMSHLLSNWLDKIEKRKEIES